MMAVSLYTSRVVLDVLGVENYGIYSVIGGVIVLLNILNSTMVGASQRFLTFEIGTGNEKRVSDTFSMCMTAHLAVAIFLLVIGETIGLWYVYNYLSIPEGRETAAMWVYQLSLITMFVSIIQSPYNASIIAYERMSFYAVVSIIDIVLKLVIVFLLTVIPFDKLIVYAALIVCINIVTFLIYKIYSQHKFRTCNYYFYYEPVYFKKYITFFGWNFLGGATTLGTQQVGNLMINSFLGVAVNAAFGVANQVNNALYSFVTNFQMAFRPQVVKLYAQNKMAEFHKLMNRSALLSYYLLFLVTFPIIINIDFVLSIWLKVVPEYSSIFCVYMIAYTAVDAIQSPLWMGIAATGNVKNYQIWNSLICLMYIPLAYICLKIGLPPYWILIVRFVLNIVASIYRSALCRWQIHFPVREYLFSVLTRAVIVSVLMYGLWVIAKPYIHIERLWQFIILYFVLASLSCIVIYTVGIGKTDRVFINNFVLDKIKIFKG